MAVDFISASIRDAVEEGTDRNDGVCFEQQAWQTDPLDQKWLMVKEENRMISAEEQKKVADLVKQTKKILS